MSETPPKRKKMGRPKIADELRKEITFRLRMPTSMKGALEASAKSQLLTASELMRKLLQEHLDKC